MQRVYGHFNVVYLYEHRLVLAFVHIFFVRSSSFSSYSPRSRLLHEPTFSFLFFFCCFSHSRRYFSLIDRAHNLFSCFKFYRS